MRILWYFCTIAVVAGGCGKPAGPTSTSPATTEEKTSSTGSKLEGASRNPTKAEPPPPSDPAARGDDKLIGSQAKDWQFGDWMNSKPLAVKDLAGKVILIRWWNAPYCRYCERTAPALNEFHASFKDKGLVVVGAYHHKRNVPLDVNEVKELAKNFKFEFPVAIDPAIGREWKTLKAWWPDPGQKRAFTSVSFLIDRKGVIRHVHPGGQYVKNDKDYAALRAKIEELLKE